MANCCLATVNKQAMGGRGKSSSCQGGEYRELRTLLEGLGETLNAVNKRLADLEARMVAEKEELKVQLKELMEKMQFDLAKMEKRVTDVEAMNHNLDQNARMKDVIITGLVIRPRSCARTADLPSDTDGLSQGEEVVGTVEEQVLEFFRSRDVDISRDGIDACFVLPGRRTASGATPAILLRLAKSKEKSALMSQRAKLRGSDVFINENLTRKNAGIAWKARVLKKDKKIDNTWVHNCRVFIKTNGAPEESRVLIIKEEQELNQFN